LANLKPGLHWYNKCDFPTWQLEEIDDKFAHFMSNKTILFFDNFSTFPIVLKEQLGITSSSIIYKFNLFFLMEKEIKTFFYIPLIHLGIFSHPSFLQNDLNVSKISNK
jgi:hypothetical protein